MLTTTLKVKIKLNGIKFLITAKKNILKEFLSFSLKMRIFLTNLTLPVSAPLETPTSCKISKKFYEPLLGKTVIWPTDIRTYWQRQFYEILSGKKISKNLTAGNKHLWPVSVDNVIKLVRNIYSKNSAGMDKILPELIKLSTKILGKRL